LFPRIRTTTIFSATNTEITTEDFLKTLKSIFNQEESFEKQTFKTSFKSKKNRAENKKRLLIEVGFGFDCSY
jgi:hypothetical protein